MSVICSALTVLLIMLLRLVDVREIGPKGTSIGLSHLNQFFFDLTGVNMGWYDITDWLGLTAVATAFDICCHRIGTAYQKKELYKS